jgi:acid phosphatase
MTASKIRLAQLLGLTSMLAALTLGAGSFGLVNAAPNGPCGTLALASTSYTHVVWLWMENHSFNTGLPLASLQVFTSDCNPSHHCSTAAQSIFGQVSSWKAYEESMPSNCARKNNGEYAVRHNPPPYFTTLSGCATFDVPYSHLATDLASNGMPTFSFITPNLIDDMHDGTVAQGDAWLQANVPAIINSNAYQSGSVVLVITWDEGEGGSATDCATNTTDVGCQVATIVVSPSTAPGTVSSTLLNHYSLLGSTEQLLGVSNLAAADPGGTTSMLGDFNL